MHAADEVMGGHQAGVVREKVGLELIGAHTSQADVLSDHLRRAEQVD